jgi:hypothetical protein
MHATFMPAAAAARVGVDGDVGEDELLSAVTGAVWPSGAYWQPDMQPAEQMTTLKSIWNDTHLPAFKDAFKERLPELGADVDTIGERLQDVAVDVGAASHPFGPGVGAEVENLDPRRREVREHLPARRRERAGRVGGRVDRFSVDGVRSRRRRRRARAPRVRGPADVGIRRR